MNPGNIPADHQRLKKPPFPSAHQNFVLSFLIGSRITEREREREREAAALRISLSVELEKGKQNCRHSVKNRSERMVMLIIFHRKIEKNILCPQCCSPLISN
jgi:hypothetical protein